MRRLHERDELVRPTLGADEIRRGVPISVDLAGTGEGTVIGYRARKHAGLIDLRRQTVQLNVVLTNQLHFRAGCEGERCVVDERLTGRTASAVLGGSFTGNLPAVQCTAEGRGNRFTVSASGGATIKLDTFTLANNEVIQLLPSDEPGVRQLPSNRGDIRQFQAGPGDAVIIATSAENLSAIAYCR